MRHMWAYKLLLLFIIGLYGFSDAYAQRRISPESQQGEAQGSSSAARQGRLRPPAELGCDINNTTSFTGRMVSYVRTRRRISLRVRTDEATTEQFTIVLAERSDPAQKFLFNGERFKPEDWKKIEMRGNRLRPGMRATVWACYVGNEPKAKIIDWQPRETQTNSVY